MGKFEVPFVPPLLQVVEASHLSQGGVGVMVSVD